MFPSTKKDTYNHNLLFLLPPIVINPPQASFFYHQHPDPYHFQPLHRENPLNRNSYRNNELDLNNLLAYDKKQEISHFTNYRKNTFLTLPQKAIKSKFCLNNGFLKTTNESINTCDKNKTNSRKSNFMYFDLSNIKMLPPQEKLSLEKLMEPRRKHERWTIEEDQLLCELKKNPRLNWREIAANFPARTLKACQFRINRLKNIKKIKGKHQILSHKNNV